MSETKVPYFKTAITAIFKNWSALQLAVAHNAGGPQSKEKADWMEEVTEQWFYDNQDIQPYELADFLEDIVITEFNNLQIDDGSFNEVGRQVCEYFQVCKTQSETAVLARLQELPRCDLSQSRVEEGDEMDEEEGAGADVVNGLENVEEMNNLKIHKQKEPEIDEDGFQMVSKKKGGRMK